MVDLGQNKPEEFRCAGCKAPVQQDDVSWRMGLDGWEHRCPDRHPQAGHCDSERIPADEVVVEPVFQQDAHARRLTADAALLIISAFAVGVLAILIALATLG